MTTKPTRVDDALATPVWKTTMDCEFQALSTNRTWDLVPLPPNTNLVGCKWVFQIKWNTNGSVNRYKARLVAKRFH